MASEALSLQRSSGNPYVCSFDPCQEDPHEEQLHTTLSSQVWYLLTSLFRQEGQS